MSAAPDPGSFRDPRGTVYADRDCVRRTVTGAAVEDFEFFRQSGLLALAVVHHPAIGRNVPLPAVVDWLIRIAPTGVVESADEEDTQVRRMLAQREDIFPDYSLERLLAEFGGRARIVETTTLQPSGRTLLWFDARGDG